MAARRMVRMPVMNGFEFIRTFQATDLPGKDQILLVVVTSSLGEGDKVKVKDLGVNHFITKLNEGNGLFVDSSIIITRNATHQWD